MLSQDCSSFRMQSGLKRTLWRSQKLSMAQRDISMPALSSTMKEGRIVSWNKKVGDKVNVGDVLLVVESDKADMDVESFEDGYIAAIFTPEGGTSAVGAVLATIVDTPEEIASASAPKKAHDTSVKSSAIETGSSKASPASSAQKPSFDSIMMPSLSSTMKEGKIVSWSKKVGDRISSGDMLLVVESDKADMDVESYEDGYLAAILVKDGEVAAVGSPVAYVVKSQAEIAAVQEYAANPNSSGFSSGESSTTSSMAPDSGAKSANFVQKPDSNGDASGRISASGYAKSVAKESGIDLRSVNPSRSDQYITANDVLLAKDSSATTFIQHVSAEGVINATPMARKLAEENRLDIRKISGTGNFGRVIPDDVLRAAGKLPAATTTTAKPSAVAASSPESSTKAAAAAPLPDGTVAMSGMQKAVAKNMEKSLSVPVFRVSRDIATDKFDQLYAKLKSKGVSVSALLAKAVADVCKKHPIMNAAYGENGNIVFHKDVNVAMAVAMDGGLLTPTIMKAQDQDVFSIARTWKDLVERAKSKKLSPAEYSSGTITISNLGMFGVSSFDAILPPNTGAILAISASQPRVVQLPNGYFSVEKAMTVTVTSDHRHIYGAHVAEFLRDLADLLENNVDSLIMG